MPRDPFAGGAFDPGGIADPEADDDGGGGGGGGRDRDDDRDRNDDPGSVTRDRGGAGAGGGDEPTVGVGDSGGGGGGSTGPSRQGRDDRTDGDAGATITDPAPAPDPAPDSGGSPGGSSPPLDDVGGASGAAPDPTPDREPPTSTTDDPIDRVSDAAASLGAGISDVRQEAQEFQAETTPVRDAGASVREELRLPSESELAADANEAIGAAAGVSPREARLRARGEAIGGLSDGADAVEDAVPGGRRTLQGAAVVAAAAEPTPIGEALVFGTGAAGALGGSAASNPEQGEGLVPESPFTQPEIGQPADPDVQPSELGVGETRPQEVGLPDDLGSLQGGRQEIGVPDGQLDGGELDVPDSRDTDITTLRTQQLLGRQEGRERDRGGSDRISRDRDDELQEILSGGGTLGEIEDSGEPTVDDGGAEVTVPEDFTSRPTGFDGFEPADSSVAEPTFPESDVGPGLDVGGVGAPTLPPGIQDPRQQPDGRADTIPGQSPDADVGPDVDELPDIDVAPEFDFGQPGETVPDTDFGTPNPTQNPTPNRFGDPTNTGGPPTDTTGRRRRQRPRLMDLDDDEDDDLSAVGALGDTAVINPTRTLSEVDDDLQAFFGGQNGP